MTISLNGTTGIQFPDSSLQAAAASPYVLKNRIINGDMRIDQRNAGASVNIVATYTVDRFLGYESNATAVMTAQQSSTAPTGFSKSLLFTTTTGAAVAASDYTQVRQIIEGYNVADLNFGTANAQTITLSFWVRGSITGTYGLAFTNGAEDRSRLTSYTINAANTWEQKTVTIAGDTSGTWLATNGAGLIVIWDLGGGSSNGGTITGSWVAGVAQNLTGGVKLQATTGATLYITGVQLEVGSTATPFERRLYNQELANCQRYLPALNGIYWTTTGYAYSANNGIGFITFPVSARTAPTGITFSSLSHFTVANSTNTTYTPTGIVIDVGNPAGTSIIWTTSTGLTSGTPTRMYASNASAQILFTGCEL
jgi:hypothetical protein